MARLPAQTFGKYQILERIATGGMAEIYRARLEGIAGFQRTFAIKRILPHLSQDQDYIAMLVEEAKIAGLLSHANIVQIVDLGQVDGAWYLAMEYVDGPDLGAVMMRAREKGLVLPVPHAAFVALELLKGLDYAHQRTVMRGGRPVPLHIIHRDISPPNILLSMQGEVKLTDFGIARAAHKVLETQAGIVKGRFDYMSPEHAAGGKDIDQRSDLFSVGVVLYEMLTGEHPFRDETEIGTLERVREGTYEPASARNPDVPQSLDRIVARALEVDRRSRFNTATAFKDALDRFFHDSGFIFTQSTLEAYLKGLFPDRDYHRNNDTPPGVVVPPPPRLIDPDEDVRDAATPQGPNRPPPLPEPPAPMRPPDLENYFHDGPDAPTHVMGRGHPQTLEGPPPRPRQLVPEDFVARPGGDDPTLIRRAPMGTWEEPQDTAVQSKAAPPPEMSVAAVIERAVERTNAVKVRRRRTDSLTSALIGVVLMLAGFVIGGVGVFLVTGFLQPEPVVVPATQLDAELRVNAPDGANVEVNGGVVTGPVMVPANLPTQVLIRMPDGTSWQESLTLLNGETRVVVVTVATPTLKR